MRSYTKDDRHAVGDKVIQLLLSGNVTEFYVALENWKKESKRNGIIKNADLCVTIKSTKIGFPLSLQI